MPFVRVECEAGSGRAYLPLRAWCAGCRARYAPVLVPGAFADMLDVVCPACGRYVLCDVPVLVDGSPWALWQAEHDAQVDALNTRLAAR